MRLLTSTDFALRVLMRLADDPAAPPVSVAALAAELGLSRDHLHKIVQELAGLGVVVTARGAGGGVRLARPPREIRLGTLVRALEAGQAVVECFRADGGCCSLFPVCRMRGFIGAAQAAFYASLEERTLADCLAPT